MSVKIYHNFSFLIEKILHNLTCRLFLFLSTFSVFLSSSASITIFPEWLAYKSLHSVLINCTMWSSYLSSSSSCFPRCSWSSFFRPSFFRVQLFQGPAFSESRSFRVQLFQGPGFSGSGSRVRGQVLEVAIQKVVFKNYFNVAFKLDFDSENLS